MRTCHSLTKTFFAWRKKIKNFLSMIEKQKIFLCDWLKKKINLSNACHILIFAGFRRSFRLSREHAWIDIFKKICESVWKYFRSSEKILKLVARRERKKNLNRRWKKKIWSQSMKKFLKWARKSFKTCGNVFKKVWNVFEKVWNVFEKKIYRLKNKIFDWKIKFIDWKIKFSIETKFETCLIGLKKKIYRLKTKIYRLKKKFIDWRTKNLIRRV